MTFSMILLVVGVGLGAAGHYFSNPALSGWGFAAAVAALIVWLARNAWEQRSARGDDGAYAGLDTGLASAQDSHHDAGGAAPDAGGAGDSGGGGSDP